VINRLQEALEGTRDRESHLAERVAASVADGHRSPHAFLHSFYTSPSIPRSSSPPMVRLRTRQQALLHSSWSREHDGQVAHTNHAGTGAPSHAGIVIGYVAATGASTAIAPATTLKNYSGSSRSLQPKATCSCATPIPAAWRSMTSPTTRSPALDRHSGPRGSIWGSAILAASPAKLISCCATQRWRHCTHESGRR
jgi:hypothetical protein